MGQKCLVLGDHLARQAPCLDDFLAIINIEQQRVDGAHALLDPAA